MPRYTYREAGVDVDRDNALSRSALRVAARTFVRWTDLVNGLITITLDDIKKMERPRLLAGTDGVGTKPSYAFVSGRHKVIGSDLVAMCVNDLVRNNVRPRGFLDYIARSDAPNRVVLELLEGMAEACQEYKCAIIGGEIASMSGYPRGEYEVVGFALGFQDRDKLIDGSSIAEGDLMFGLPSSGLHNNGYSLVRKVFPAEEAIKEEELVVELLRPTRIYVDQVLGVSERLPIHGWAHITGTGIVGKLGDIIPDGLQAQLHLGSWPVPPIFKEIKQKGGISDREMRRTFNLGLGMIGVAPEGVAKQAVKFLAQQGEAAYLIGEVVKRKGKERVVFF
ncbi:MAG: phosphoribosylformylglycinamidine cyclo-ligase [bacterium]|nr:phosphoribosylformylglycinamidine cyclo-ligase [bacterium]